MALYKPTEAARILSERTDRKVSASTLRSWCSNDEVAPYLSDLATPDPGQARLLTDHDLAVLVRVQELRRQSLSFAEIGLKLAESPGISTEGPQEDIEAPGEAIAPAAMVDTATLTPLLTALQSSQVKSEQIHVLQDGVKRHERDINQIRLILFMLLVVMVLVLVAVVLLIAVMR